MSQWRQYLGFAPEAERALPAAEECRLPVLRQWRDLQLGRLLASQGLYAEAAEALAATGSGPSPLLSEHARLLHGESLEFRGLWEEALAAYSALAREAQVPAVRRSAAFWTRRVRAAMEQYGSAFGTTAYYWGEDRQTQGEWYGYGEDACVLCSRLAPGDYMGGTAAPVRYTYGTPDPERGAWPWNWDSVTPHPSLLLDPFLDRPSAANWDDGGEKYAPGTGPDLLVGWSIPDGTYRLSLYLANDINYYEPGREYTIYLINETNQVLAACPVRHFIGGVYHHFVVRGPQKLNVRVYRNLSINVLLQGIFMDRLDERGEEAASGDTLGPFGELLSRQPPRMGSRPSCGFVDAASRRDAVAGLLAAPLDGLLGRWWTCRLLNGYGAGRHCEEAALACVRQTVRETVGSEAAAELWHAAAAAQREAGRRQGVTLFTRLGLEEAQRLPAELPERLARLEGAIQMLQADWRQYIGYPGDADPFATTGPTDEAYSRELADQFVAEAKANRPLMAAAADILPLARDLCRMKRTVLPCRLFEAVGAGNLGSSDLLLYAAATRDPQTRLQLTKLANAQNPAATRSSLWVGGLVERLVEGGDYDGAETEMAQILDTPDIPRSLKANAAYNLGLLLMGQGRKDRSIKWLELVIERFADTQFAQVARKCIDYQKEN
jgi:hypothetical protein